MFGFIKNIFNGVNAFIKFSKYNYSELFFNNYWRSKNIHKDIFACLFSIHLPCPMMGEEVKIVGENKYECSSCILYIALFSIFFTINIGIGNYFLYCKYMKHNKENVFENDYVYQTKNY